MNSKLALCFALALISVEAKSSNANCEEKERSLAALDLAVDSLSKAKDLYPNCEDGDEIANSSECGKKDKSLGYIDVALYLVSDARKSFPVCPPPPKIVDIHRRPMDCAEVMENGLNASGIYAVWPRSRVSKGRPIQVMCDMQTAGGGWTLVMCLKSLMVLSPPTVDQFQRPMKRRMVCSFELPLSISSILLKVIQRRGNFSKQENFNRDWMDYKNGFGNLSRDFWIGNDNIYALSNQGDYSLRFDMMDVSKSRSYELFREFWIGDENSNYTLRIGQPSGTSGDSMTYHNGSMFSTKDRKNDKHTEPCAILRQSGFWYHKCSHCNPNGLHRPGAKNNTVHIYYSSWKGFDGLFSFEMKLKRL